MFPISYFIGTTKESYSIFFRTYFMLHTPCKREKQAKYPEDHINQPSPLVNKTQKVF
jgi:hypothetical protein